MDRLRTLALAALITAMAPLGAAMHHFGASAHLTDEPADTAKATSAEVNEGSVIDEVVWVVGDEPILKSDIEALRLQAETEGVRWDGNPDCVIPEQLAVQKLFLHQAAIDSIEVTESDITQSIDEQIN